MNRTATGAALAVGVLVLSTGCNYEFGKYRPPSAADGGTGCAGFPGVTFCEDFDDVSDLAALATKWNATAPDGAGTLKILTMGTDFPSNPSALSALAGDNQQASLSHAAFEGTPASIHVGYDLRVDDDSITGALDGAALTGVVMGTSVSSDPTVAFFLGSPGLELGWNDPSMGLLSLHSTNLGTKAQVGQWSGRWEVDITMSNGAMAVTHDGATVGSPPNLPAAFLSPTEITLVAGLPFDTGNSGTVGVTIDDLVLDLK